MPFSKAKIATSITTLLMLHHLERRALGAEISRFNL